MASDLIGSAPDQLTMKEQLVLGGKWIALEIYTPEKLPLRRIAAVGDSAADCIRQLAARGVNPLQFEFKTFKRPAV